MPLPEDSHQPPRRARRALDPSDEPGFEQPFVAPASAGTPEGSMPRYWGQQSTGAQAPARAAEPSIPLAHEPFLSPSARAAYWAQSADSAATAEQPAAGPAGPDRQRAGGRRQREQERARTKRAFRGAITRTIAGTIVPGLGLLGTRAHWLGLLILTLLIGGSVSLGIFVSRNPGVIAGTALQTQWMLAIAIALAVLAIVWVTIITGTYLVSKPRSVTARQRKAGAAVVGLLSFLVSTPLAVGSAFSLETAILSGNIFESEDDKQSQTRPTLDVSDPWADKERVNILLLGGDSGEGRDADLGVRTDTMMLASIDTASGNAVLIQLPRNLVGPVFPDGSRLAEYFPYGFDNGSSSMLNAVWQDVPNLYPELFTDTDYPGADALKWAVQGITDLKVDYFVMLNIDGLVNLIDAMGGVTVNVNFPIAIGGSNEYGCGEGGWIADGPDRHLNGYEAMWYARSRCNDPNSDFGRMQRQSCLVDAVIAQADPATMATRYEAIAQAAGDMITTDIPQEHLSAIVDLAYRVQRSNTVSRLAFVPGSPSWYDSDYPDFELMRRAVADAITASLPGPMPGPGETEQPQTTEAPAAPEPQPTQEQPTQTADGPDSTSSPDPVEDVADACAYRYQEPAGNVEIPASVPRMTPPATESDGP